MATTQTVYTSNEVPEWLDTALQGLVSDAGTLSSEPYPAYQGQQIAGLDPLQQQAIGYATQNYNYFQPYMQQAMYGTLGATQTPTGVTQAANASLGFDPYSQLGGANQNLYGAYNYFGGFNQGSNLAGMAGGNTDPYMAAMSQAGQVLGPNPYEYGAASGVAGALTGPLPGQYNTGLNYANQGAQNPAYFGTAVNMASQGGVNPYAMTAQQLMYQSQQNPTGQDIQQYMDPYTQMVKDVALADQKRAYDIEMNNIGSQAALTGAFGGSRQGVLEAESTRNYLDRAGSLSAQLSSDSYRQALAQVNQQQGLDFQAGQGIGQLGDLVGRLGLSGASTLGNLSAQERQALMQAGGMYMQAGSDQLGALQAAGNLYSGLGLGSMNNQVSGLNALTGLYGQNTQALLGAGGLYSDISGQQAGLATNIGEILGNQSLQAGGQYLTSQQQAASILAAQQALQQQGYSQYGNLAGLTQGLYDQAGSNLYAYGGELQALQQAQLNTAYENFQNQQMWPYQQLAFYSDILRGTPLQQTTTQRTQSNTSSSASDWLGLGVAGVGALAETGAFGGDGWLSDIGSWIGL